MSFEGAYNWLDRCARITDNGLYYLKEGLKSLTSLQSLALLFGG